MASAGNAASRPKRPNGVKTVDAILAAHQGRNPALLTLKWAKLRDSPFSFFRGTAALFYGAWARAPLPAAPSAWICGDAHLENVGSYKGDNGVPYFDLNDFDEACLAPAHWDLGRALTGLYLLQDSERARHFFAAYRARLISGKPQHIEPETARGVIATLLANVQERRQKDFLASRVHGSKIILREGRTFALDAPTRRRALNVFNGWAKRQPGAAFYRVKDICGRIAGNGSLGVDRYVVLVRGEKRHAIMDMKQAVPSAAAARARLSHPGWTCEAERVATLQHFMQYVPMGRLGWTAAGGTSFVIRELQPVEDRLDRRMLAPADYDDFIARWAELVASAQLRVAGLKGSAPLQALVDFGQRLDGPRAKQIHAAAKAAAATQRRQFREFRQEKSAG
jgi:uncharacterized protein (DUF2252 family)